MARLYGDAMQLDEEEKSREAMLKYLIKVKSGQKVFCDLAGGSKDVETGRRKVEKGKLMGATGAYMTHMGNATKNLFSARTPPWPLKLLPLALESSKSFTESSRNSSPPPHCPATGR